MKARIHWVAAALFAALLVASSAQVGRCQLKSDAPAAKPAQAETSIVGVWQADSVWMTPPNGNRRQIDGKDTAFSVTIAEKTLTMRVRDRPLAEMSYALDAKQDPWAIDLKSAEGAMLGICRRTGDRLQINLNDEAQGRPRSFNESGNGMMLSLTAFEVESLFVSQADGSNRRRIVSMTDYTQVGSPSWSHDGKRIAFDGWKSIYGEGLSNAHVLVTDADGRGLKDLGPGAMPTWSPDDKQLAFSSYGPERGVCIMNADGSDRRCVAADGWGVRWSPKQNELAFTVYDNGHAGLCVYDVANKQRRLLLDRSYQRIYWGLAWSPDGAWIGFKGFLSEGGAEIAAVSAAGEKKGFKIILSKLAVAGMAKAGEPLAWGGNGKQILLTMQPKASGICRLYVADFDEGKRPRLIAGLPDDWAVGDMGWSADGKQIVFSACAVGKRAQARPAAQTAAARSQSVNNLKQITLAMLNHESAIKAFPLPASLDPKGKPLLSWRVHILPYMEQGQLYKEFKLDEPWDSPHNRALIDRMPSVYRSPLSSNREKGLTNYLLPVGNGAAFRADKPTRMADIQDGTSNTLMVLEVDDDRAVPWTKPDDWQYDPKQPMKGLGNLAGGRFNTAFCDGSVHQISREIRPQVLCNLIERADGQAVDASEIRQPAAPQNRRVMVIRPPVINAAAAGLRAIQQYDADKDGRISGNELAKCPSLAALAAQRHGAVTADDITTVIKRWQTSKVGRVGHRCVILHNGKPLEGATVTFVPEKFLQSNILAGSGATDENGLVQVSVPCPQDEPGGIPLGFYRIEITKEGKKIPAKYNTETSLGTMVSGSTVGAGARYNLVY